MSKGAKQSYVALVDEDEHGTVTRRKVKDEPQTRDELKTKFDMQKLELSETSAALKQRKVEDAASKDKPQRAFKRPIWPDPGVLTVFLHGSQKQDVMVAHKDTWDEVKDAACECHGVDATDYDLVYHCDLHNQSKTLRKKKMAKMVGEFNLFDGYIRLKKMAPASSS